LKDLLVKFKENYYYHQAFAGKFSLKNILPVLCPDFTGYKNLKITDGTMAMQNYESLDKLPLNEQNETKKALKDYCNTDTYAMVKILKVLINLLKE
jgi:hypothetical protein